MDSKNLSGRGSGSSSWCSTRVAIGLLAADAVMIVLHVIQWISPIADRGFSLGDDRGIAEALQYAKLFALVGILASVYRSRREPIFASLLFLFGYLLADDALILHEKAGALLAARLGLAPAFGLRSIDFGEMLYAVSVGILLLGQFAVAYRATAPSARKDGRVFFVLILLLGCCGVGFDALHSLALDTPLGPLLEMFEDGGEMIVVSLMVAYATSLLPAGSNLVRRGRREVAEALKVFAA